MLFFNRLAANRIATCIVIALVAVVFYVTRAEPGFPLDDSWIHQVYARNLAQRGEWAFVPGQPSAASTSPLYTVLLAIGYWLNIAYTVWPHLLGGLALGLMAWSGGRLAERLTQINAIYWPVALSMLLSWHLVWAASAGMETMIFASLVMLQFYFASAEFAISQRETTIHSTVKSIVWRGSRFGFIAGLTTLARPEGLGAAGLIGLAFLWGRPLKTWKATITWALSAVLAFAFCMTPYIWLNWQLTGGVLPNTAAAKQAQLAVVIANSDLLTRIRIMLEPLIAGGQLFLLPGMIYFLWRASAMNHFKRWLAFALILWPIALVLLYAARLPAPFQHGRYVIPALPAALVAGIVGMDALSRRYSASLWSRVLIRSCYGSAFATFVFFFVGIGADAYRQDVQVINEEMVLTAYWIHDNIQPDDLLAVHDIGAVGFFAPRPILDIAGLLNPEVIAVGYDNIQIWELMEQREAKYLMAFPDQIPGPFTQDSRLCLVYRSQGEASRRIGGPAMSVYRLAYNEICDV